MGKSKKLDARLRLYYKGPAKKPTKVATDSEMKLIERAFVECLTNRTKHSFKSTWMDKEVDFLIIVGLSASLRHLKRGHTKALIFDDTATGHTAGLLIEFANKLNIPVVQSSKLIELAPKFDLKTLLVVSLIDASSQDENVYSDNDPKPKRVQSSIESDAFNKLTSYLQGTREDIDDVYEFKCPEIVKVVPSGKSKAKKIVRRGEKQSKRLQAKTKQVGEKARGES